MAKTALLITLAVIAVVFVILWAAAAKQRQRSAPGQEGGYPTPLHLLIGFFANFFDTLGIGSFATTTTVYKLKKLVDDRLVPGTLNTGHALPTITQALIYITIVKVDFTTLILLIIAAVVGSWLGAGVVSGLSRRAVQIGMGTALLIAAGFMLASQMQWLPGGDGLALELTGTKLFVGLAINFLLGALMTLGIGLYAPCMIMVNLLGMDPTAAFPIMMGSCAFLMPIGGVQFARKGGYDLRAAVGLAIGGVPGVLIAAFWVVSLSLGTVRWLVLAVVIYTALMMLRSAATATAADKRAATA
jgi:uncharacterized membrane protein YfcA